MARISTLPAAGSALALALAVALALPAAAGAQSTTVPPGNSEADQYFETVPDGKGNKSLDNSRDPADVLTPEQLAALEELGEEGLAAAQLAAATAPEGSGRGNKGGGDGAGGKSGSAAVSGTTTSAPSKDGLGGLLWVIVVGAAAGGAGYLILSARGRDRAGS